MADVTFETDLRLDKLLVSDKAMEAKVRRIVEKVLNLARNSVRGRMKLSSTKAAYLAIRKSVYKKILGGNINIAPSRYHSDRRAPLPPVRHRLETATNTKGNHRGGNRMPRSTRTEDLLTYWGVDRGFILRFLNAGTPQRNTNGTRYVGQIQGQYWFGNASQTALEDAAKAFDTLMDKLIEQEFNR